MSNNEPDISIATSKQLIFKLKESTEKSSQALRSRIREINDLLDFMIRFIPLVVFTAGVQGQVVALTFNHNETPIHVASNWFGFNGLVFDIVGALWATWRTISRKADFRAMENQLHLVEFTHNTLEKSFENRPDKLTEFNRLLDEWQGLLKEISSMYPSLLPLQNDAYEGTEDIVFSTEGLSRSSHEMINESLAFYTMGLGVSSLLISVILHAAATQFRRVWLGCIMISGLPFLYFVIDFWLGFLSSAINPKRRALELSLGLLRMQDKIHAYSL